MKSQYDHTLTSSESTWTEGGGPVRLMLIAFSKSGTEVVTFGSEDVITVGRSDAASMRLSDPSLSRLHARFRRQNTAVVVSDLDSRNGTFLRGQRITEAELGVGQSVVLGNVTVELRIAPTRDAALLGIADYDSIRARLSDELLRARNFRRPLSLLLVRPKERIKLANYAGECLPALRAVDRVGVYDPYSLLILLPEVSRDRADQTARSLLSRAPSGIDLRVGIAAFPESGSSEEKLLAEAVRAAHRESSATSQSTLAEQRAGEEVVSASPPMQEVEKLIERLAASRISVLIRGETGVGKEVVARRIHERSARAPHPLVAVNCGAIPEHLVESVLFGHARGAFTGADRNASGLFEQASGGTLFLDEIGELTKAAQASLLRVLDTGRVRPVGGAAELTIDVRVIAATHRDLPAMIEAGTFREDLYHRLNGVTLSVPPLRQRREEVAALARHFVALAEKPWGGASWQMNSEALARLTAYDWPGNVRELRNVIERAVALAEDSVITENELPAHVSGQPPVSSSPRSAAIPEGGVDLRSELERHEQHLIQRALETAGGHQRKAAELLRLPLRTLERKLSRFAKSDPNKS